MLLAIDIGNTNMVLGLHREGKWIHQWRIHSDAEKTGDEYFILLQDLFEDAGVRIGEIEQIIIGSVVPRLTGTFLEVLARHSSCTPIVLDETTDSGINIATDHPPAVGADLIAGAAGAFHRYRDNCIIVDFGTATTIMAVSDEGALLGGAICAGLNITVTALVDKAARLSQIPLRPPSRITAGNTVEAMQSGLFIGHLCMVEGLVQRMKRENGPSRTIATGGLAETLARHTDCFDHVDTMLVLDGLQIIAARVRKAAAT